MERKIYLDETKNDYFQNAKELFKNCSLSIIVILSCLLLTSCAKTQQSKTRFKNEVLDSKNLVFNNYEHNYRIKLQEGFKVKFLSEKQKEVFEQKNSLEFNRYSIFLMNSKGDKVLVYSIKPDSGNVKESAAVKLAYLLAHSNKDSEAKRKALNHICLNYGIKANNIDNIEFYKNFIIFESDKLKNKKASGAFIRASYAAKIGSEKTNTFNAMVTFSSKIPKEEAYSEILDQFEFTPFTESERAPNTHQ